MDLLFGFSGRIGRAKWWLAEFSIIIVWAIVFAVFAAFVGVVDPSAEHAAGELSNGGLSVGLALFAGIVLSAWINIAATVKRYHDRDKSSIWFCIIFVPVIGPIWQIVECGILPGTPGGNRFGPSPGSGGGRAFQAEVDAHIAQMKAQRTPAQQQPQRAAVSASAPAASSRRPAGSASFGRRGV